MPTGEMIAWGFLFYLVVALGISSIRSWQISTWPSVNGKLLNADVDYLHMVERGSAYEDVEYEYQVAGNKYVGTRLSPLIVRGQVGPKIKKQLAKIQYISSDQVKVFYNPKNPGKSYLVKESWLNIFS